MVRDVLRLVAVAGLFLLTDVPSSSGQELQRARGIPSKSIFPVAPVTNAVIERNRISQLCLSGQLDKKTCSFRWRNALAEELEHLTSEHTWNLSTNYWVRYNTFHGRFLHNYWMAVEGFRFSRWHDDNPFLDDWIGHPMMGAISSYIEIQNNPRAMTLEIGKDRAYWHSRLVAMAWSAVYSTQWKLGPLSEASIGNTGGPVYFDNDAHKWTNGSGFVGLVSTPVGGTVWLIGEDLLDRYVVQRLEERSTNVGFLLGISILTPSRSFANLMRWKAPWYRDIRTVKAGARRTIDQTITKDSDFSTAP
jgi:hypothetical protein